MAVNPIYGPIPDKAMDDPNGYPGQTSGNVPPTVSHQRTQGLPTAGATESVPPFLPNPKLNPLDETFGGHIPGDPGE